MAPQLRAASDLEATFEEMAKAPFAMDCPGACAAGGGATVATCVGAILIFTVLTWIGLMGSVAGLTGGVGIVPVGATVDTAVPAAVSIAGGVGATAPTADGAVGDGVVEAASAAEGAGHVTDCPYEATE